VDAGYVVSYSWFKEKFNKPDTPIFLGSVWSPFAAGILADISVQVLAVPSDVIVQRMQVQEYGYNGSWDACKKIYASEGIKGFYRGMGASVLAWVPASGVWWLSYEYFKRILYPYRIRKVDKTDTYQRNYASEMVAAAVSTCISTVMFNPLEIVKTRLQTQHQTQGKITNTFTGLVRLLQEEGVTSMTKGMMPRLISRVPLAVVSAFLYEIVLHASKKDPLKVDEQSQR